MDIIVDASLAAFPLLLIFVLMVAFRWPAWKAGVSGFVAALALAWVWFGFELPGGAPVDRPTATAGSLIEAAFTTATILWILVGALSIHALQERRGATNRLRDAIQAITPEPRLAGILIAWFFALFLEGAAGFGTPVALTAPLLLAFGFRPVDAVAIALLGHAAAVSFGAVGTPVLTQADITAVSARDIAAATSLYHGAIGFVLLGSAIVVMDRGLGGRGVATASTWWWALYAVACFMVPSVAIAQLLGPELPSLGGALIGAMLFVPALLAWQSRRPKESASTDSSARSPHGTELALAAAPYLLLVALVVITRVGVPIRGPLQDLEWTWQLFDGFGGSFQPLYHPGTLLAAAFLAGALIQRAPLGEVGDAIFTASKRLIPVSIALLAMLALSRIMVHSGMTAALALAAAEHLGALWPLLAPSVGVLGTFTTGSATASNVLFSDFQLETAERLELSTVPMLGAQSAGAAVGNVIAPHNIIAGAATVDLKDGEGDVLKRTVLPCIVYAAGLGLIAFGWTFGD